MARKQRESRFNLGRFREGKAISLDDIAEKTKISPRFLLAIESGEYEKLPGGIFNTSYLRQYAAAVGYNEDALLEHYATQTRRSEGDESAQKKHSIFSRWLSLAGHVFQ